MWTQWSRSWTQVTVTKLTPEVVLILSWPPTFSSHSLAVSRHLGGQLASPPLQAAITLIITPVHHAAPPSPFHPPLTQRGKYGWPISKKGLTPQKADKIKKHHKRKRAITREKLRFCSGVKGKKPGLSWALAGWKIGLFSPTNSHRTRWVKRKWKELDGTSNSTGVRRSQ